MRIIAAVAVALALLASGCSSSSSDDTSPAVTADEASRLDKGAVVDIVIKDGKVTPQGGRVEAAVGDRVTLRITTDADEEIHVHSDPEHEYEVAAGSSVTKAFTVGAPGQVAIEAHHLDATIVQLVVRP